MLQIAICEDDPEQLAYTARLVQQALAPQACNLVLYSSGTELLSAVKSGSICPAVAVLDIELQSESGITLAKELNSVLASCKIIFLTGYTEYITASYKVDHVWYIIKTLAEDYLGQALQKALSISASESEPLGITARAGRKAFFVPLDDILYLDRFSRKMRIICKNDVYPVSGTPASLLTEAVSPFFVQCHQGYWVNLRQVRTMDRNEFVLVNDVRVPISRGYQALARKRFFEQFHQL